MITLDVSALPAILRFPSDIDAFYSLLGLLIYATISSINRWEK
jgi:hypothetical protein